MTVPQVSQLFADHPDLLMEFTYFLPDAVQEQVSEAERSGGEGEGGSSGGNSGRRWLHSTCC